MAYTPPPGTDYKNVALHAGQVFTPSTPIDARQLFAGRDEQTRLILDVINQKGQHAILYGERGVGKTSLANILTSYLTVPNGLVLAPRINCDSTDTFDTVWRKVFDQITLNQPVKQAGFGAMPGTTPVNYTELLGPKELTPDSVRRTLTVLSQQQALLIFVIDEFDRLLSGPRRAFADAIKSLSDHAVKVTIIIVGVADSVEQLLEEHVSVERALVQVRMPRMSPGEIKSITSNGVAQLGMTIAPVALSRIAKLSQGLPHYAHLLSLYATRSALDEQRLDIDACDVDVAVARAISGAQQSVRSAYDYAIRSPRKDNLFADVLLACAMADTNELGFFAAQDVRTPMREITGRPYEIPSFAQHLNEFCEEKRGEILHKDGMRRRFRYRFANPLLQPFVIMRGIDSKRISANSLD